MRNKNVCIVNNIWIGIFYGIVVLVVLLLVYLVVEIIVKGWGFWDLNFLFGKLSNMMVGGGIGF